MTKLRKEIKEIICNYYPGFEGLVGKKDKKNMLDSIIDKLDEFLTENYRDEDDENVAYCRGWNDSIEKLRERVKE